MALGKGMMGSVPDYIGMADSAAQSGVSTARGLFGALQQGYDFGNKMQDRQRMMQAREAFQGAWNSGNPEDVQRVMAQFPEYAAQIQKLIGVRDDQHRKDVGSMAVQLSGLLDSGNIQGAQDFIRQHKSMFDPSGMFSADSVANAIGTAAQADSVIDKDGNHSNKLGQWKDWAKKLSRSTLTPVELANEEDKDRRYQLDVKREAEQELRDQQRHEEAMYRETHPRSFGGGINRDHSGGLRGLPLAKYIVENGLMPDGTVPTAELAQWAGQALGKSVPGKKLSLNSPDQKANAANKQALQSFQRRNKAMSDVLGKTAQADARLNSLNTSTPVGQLAAEYQFLTVEAPTIGNSVATAAGVSNESVRGWSDKLNQLFQEARQQGSLTPQMVSDIKEAANQEYQAIKDLQTEAAAAMASKFDLSDPTTAAMVEGTTGYVSSADGGESGRLDITPPPKTPPKTVKFGDLKK